jgi:hypothetical protein
LETETNNFEITNEKSKIITLYDLKDQEDSSKYKLSHESDLTFNITGKRIEQIVRMTDFLNPEAVMRVYDVLEKI